MCLKITCNLLDEIFSVALWQRRETRCFQKIHFLNSGFWCVGFLFSLCTLVEQAVKTILEEWADFTKIESQRIWNRKDFILDILSPEEIIIYRLHYISCLVISSNVCLATVEKWISVVSCSLEKINYETLKKKWNKTSDESAASENQINKMFQLVIATVNSSTWNCITGCEMK